MRDVSVDVCPLPPAAPDPPPLDPEPPDDTADERVDAPLRLLPDEPDVRDDGATVVDGDGDGVQAEPLADGDW
jgi:hypothetical protein